MYSGFIGENTIEFQGKVYERLYNHPQGQRWRVFFDDPLSCEDGEPHYDYVNSKDLISLLDKQSGVDIELQHESRKWTVRMVKRSNSEICFYYPSGEFMGGLDNDGASALAHPSEEINDFIRSTVVNGGARTLLDFNYALYCDFEHQCLAAINKHFPMFLTEEIKLHSNLK